jgi:hypothetical protein
MSQDRTSGARASEWGHKTAQLLANKLGATGMRGNSNQCQFNGDRIVIKCAAPATPSVGVTFKMLDGLDRVVAAFQLDDGSFELWSVSPDQFKSAMRETKSRGRSAGKVGLVERSFFQRHGKSMGRVRPGAV